MIPFANDTITLLHKSGASYEPVIIHGCSYRRMSRRTMIDGAVSLASVTTCRIPAGNPMPAPGDVIVLGEMHEGVRGDIEFARLLESKRPKGAFRVQSVADHARPGVPVPHFAAVGE